MRAVCWRREHPPCPLEHAASEELTRAAPHLPGACTPAAEHANAARPWNVFWVCTGWLSGRTLTREACRGAGAGAVAGRPLWGAPCERWLLGIRRGRGAAEGG